MLAIPSELTLKYNIIGTDILINGVHKEMTQQRRLLISNITLQRRKYCIYENARESYIFKYI